MKPFRSTTLMCFSPAVMAATIVIELGLAAWVLVRYAANDRRRLIVALLVLLAAFQATEFKVCMAALPGITASRLGYVFITLLPPLGVHLVTRLRGAKTGALVYGGYALAAAFIAAFAFLPTALNTPVCAGNYVIFALANPLAALYGYYYFGLELLGVYLATQIPRRAPRYQRDSLRWMAAGYLVMMVPTAVIAIILPATRYAVPSVMCGFAVLLALVLGLKVAPLARA